MIPSPVMVAGHLGTFAVDMPSTDYMTMPDSAAVSISSFSVECDTTLADWVTGTAYYLAGKWAAAGQRSWSVQVSSTGYPAFNWSFDGTNNQTLTADNALGATDAVRRLLKVEVTTDPGVLITAKFYEKATPDAAWVQNGADKTYSTSPATRCLIYDSTSGVQVNGRSTTINTPTVATVHSFAMRDSGGTLVAGFDNGDLRAAGVGTGPVVTATETWTLASNATIVEV